MTLTIRPTWAPIVGLWVASCSGTGISEEQPVQSEPPAASSSLTPQLETPDVVLIPGPEKCRSLGSAAQSAFTPDVIDVTQCDVDADCQPYDDGRCWEACDLGTWGRAAYQQAHQAAVADACAAFRATDCKVVGWISCPRPPEVLGVRCKDHVCLPITSFTEAGEGETP